MDRLYCQKDGLVQPAKSELIEQAAEAWVRLVLFSIKQKKQLFNQNKDKKAYEYTK